MHLLAGIAFGLLLVGGVALVAALLRAEGARVLAILSGAELARAQAQAPRPIRVSAPLRLARAPQPRARRTPLAAAA